MNRKQIVNESLQWPEIDESTSNRIIDVLESSLKNYPGLKRKKNPPKRFRKNKPKSNQEKNKIDDENEEDSMASQLKSHIRIGINAITKSLEREPEKIMFVLVCRSCKPLAVLTRHIQLMCAMSNIPAGCIHSLTTRLKSQLNINTISALLVFKQTETDQDAIRKLLNDWSSQIPPLFPKLNNPFTENAALSTLPSDLMLSLIDEIKKEIDDRKDEINTLASTQMDVCENEDENEDNSDFGADFLRVDANVKYLDFDNQNFILFNDDYERKRKRLLVKNMDYY